MSRSLARRVGAVLLGAALVAVLAACTSSAPTSTTGGGSQNQKITLPTGVTGAADFDRGALVVGDGKTVVDTYIDPMCPYCGEFEKASGRALAQKVDDGTITLRVHPLNFLDPNSQGTKYSSRAGAALTCVAASDPKATLTYLAALYANQPEEQSSGLSDTKLKSLADSVGASAADACIPSPRYEAWITDATQSALNGPIPGSDLKAIKGTPTILVNGHQYPGSITDTSALLKYIGSGGK
nr:thioredoxin domain-containing protein [Planctomonas sp. JC2975]